MNATSIESQRVPSSRERFEFVVRVGELLHQFGTPSHRLERVVGQIASVLEVRCVVLYTPTAILLSLAIDGPNGDSIEKTYLRRANAGSINAGKLIDFDEALEDLECGRRSMMEVRSRMEQIASRKSIYPAWLIVLTCGFCCAVVAVLFGGGIIEVCLTAAIGAFIAGLEFLQGRLKWESSFVHSLAGFLAAIISLVFAHYVTPIDDRLVTLASLIILLPGLALTLALTELSVGHLSAGVARLAGASVTLLILVLGVAIAWKIAGDFRTLPAAPNPLPMWCYWLSALLAPFGFAILFEARIAQWPLIFVVAVSGFLTTKYFAGLFGGEVGSFFGALTVGCASNLYARIRNRPALVAISPGLIILVPGSVGYRSITALLEHQTMEGVEGAFAMLITGVSLVGGLLASSTIVPPKRSL